MSRSLRETSFASKGSWFKSPQLHAFSQVGGLLTVPPATVKIICHSDVTRLAQQSVTLNTLIRTWRHSPATCSRAVEPSASDRAVAQSDGDGGTEPTTAAGRLVELASMLAQQRPNLYGHKLV